MTISKTYQPSRRTAAAASPRASTAALPQGMTQRRSSPLPPGATIGTCCGLAYHCPAQNTGFSHRGSMQQQASLAKFSGDLRASCSRCDPAWQISSCPCELGHRNFRDPFEHQQRWLHHTIQGQRGPHLNHTRSRSYSVHCVRRVNNQSVLSKFLVLCDEKNTNGTPSGYHCGSKYMFFCRKGRVKKRLGSRSNLHHAFAAPSLHKLTFNMSSSSIIQP
mmetsp:Transcript_149578/g.479477  ORF Transcript_149578/g.479477 Transcript_149578/m.479477 type:complete len:219 (-) Transcript_149578:1582-2238(-)